MDESQSPVSQLNQPQPQQGNPLQSLQQNTPPQTQISKQQVIAGLHHLGAFQKQYGPILKSPEIGKKNIRPKIFDASATLIGQGIFSVPEIMNGIKDLPSDPVDQKKWLEAKLMAAQQAEQKLVSDYVKQGPGPEPEGPDWSEDTHKDHMTGLMGNYKRG